MPKNGNVHLSAQQVVPYQAIDANHDSQTTWTFRISVILALMCLGFVNQAFAQCDVAPGQLVTNCDFDSDTNGWTDTRGTLSHNAVIGSNDPGSMECDGGVLAAWTWCTPMQCIDVSPSTTYGAGFDVVMTSPPSMPGSYPPSAQVRYIESTTDNCANLSGGSFVASGSSFIPDSTFQQSTGTLTTTATAQSVQLELRVLNQGGNDPDDAFTVHYDDVFFGIGLVPVELMSFTIE